MHPLGSTLLPFLDGNNFRDVMTDILVPEIQKITSCLRKSPSRRSLHPADEGLLSKSSKRRATRADMEMTMTPNVVNTLEKQGRGQEWATGLISVGHEAPVAVSGSNMGQGQPTGKVLSFEESAPILRYVFHAGDRG